MLEISDQISDTGDATDGPNKRSTSLSFVQPPTCKRGRSDLWRYDLIATLDAANDKVDLGAGFLSQ